MKIAVVGTGSAGLRHLNALRCLKGITAIAVPRRPSRLPELEAAGFEVAPDLSAAVARGALAAVVATDTGRHAIDVSAALAEGMNVLVEKPMAVDSAEAKVLCQEANRIKLGLYVGCTLRFSESLNKFRQELKSIGDLHSVRIEAHSFLPDWRPGRPYQESYSARSVDGGVLRDLIHEIDYAAWIFGWPRSCQARIRNLGRLDIEAEEIAEISWETPSGCLVSLELDYLSRPTCRQIAARGAQGTLSWDGITGSVSLEGPEKQANTIKMPESNSQISLSMTKAFVQACQGTNDPRLATGDDGLRALAICDAAYRAANSRSEETVEYQ